jgi:hypothetical protein
MYTNLIIWQVVRLSLNWMTSENSLVVDGGSWERGAGGEKDARVQTLYPLPSTLYPLPSIP